jgi:hypothetical protein
VISSAHLAGALRACFTTHQEFLAGGRLRLTAEPSAQIEIFALCTDEKSFARKERHALRRIP